MSERPPPIPEKLEVLQQGADVVIRWSWFSHTVWFLLFFCIAWDSFLIFWYSVAVSAPGPFRIIAVLFPIGHIAVGLGLTYFVLCTFLNKTEVILSTDRLTVRTHPLPWRGNKSIPSADLTSFSYRERTNHRRHHHSYSTTYDVMYVDASNREKTLVKSLADEEQAEYLAHALTRFYLADHPREGGGTWGSAATA